MKYRGQHMSVAQHAALGNALKDVDAAMLPLYAGHLINSAPYRAAVVFHKRLGRLRSAMEQSLFNDWHRSDPREMALCVYRGPKLVPCEPAGLPDDAFACWKQEVHP